MIGAITFWTFFGISIWIDMLTAFIFLFIRKKKKQILNPKKKISVMIPVHTESTKDIKNTVRHIYNENYPLVKCIICGDSDTKNVEELVRHIKVRFGYKNLEYIESPDKSKAKKMNFIVEHYGNALGEFIHVRDCNVISEDKAIKDMLSHFTDKNIAAVTSYGYVHKPKNFLGRSYHYGKEWINQIGRFRKNQQEKRSAVFVVCGASTTYRVNVIREIPVPSITKTEDTHYTWLLQIHGYKLGIAKKTKISSPDVDGKWHKGLYNQIRQGYRWSCGTIQCFYIERKNLNKNKKLLYTTIIPGSIEATTYSVALILLPFFAFYAPTFFWGFIIGDTFFSLLGTIIFIPKRLLHTIFHYPQIMFYKYISATIFITALLVVSFQRITKKHHKWSNEWKASSA